MDAGVLQKAIDSVPAGPWAVGVSGGADSVALLLLLKDRSDLSLHVVHLDHQTRQGESAKDAEFVADLAAELNLPCTVAKRSEVEIDPPANNISDRYRRARFTLFRRVVDQEKLQGVVLAHHAGDQAETVLMRILRGSAAIHLGGIQTVSIVDGLKIIRPLLNISPQQLRDLLNHRDQSWREDPSNQSNDYQRNRVRHWLGSRPAVSETLMQIEKASRGARDWLEAVAPVLPESFSLDVVNELPAPLARHAVARWLIDRGSPTAEVSSATCERLIQMCGDAATSPRQHFPGELLVRRKKGVISAT